MERAIEQHSFVALNETDCVCRPSSSCSARLAVCKLTTARLTAVPQTPAASALPALSPPCACRLSCLRPGSARGYSCRLMARSGSTWRLFWRERDHRGRAAAVSRQSSRGIAGAGRARARDSRRLERSFRHACRRTLSRLLRTLTQIRGASLSVCRANVLSVAVSLPKAGADWTRSAPLRS